MMVSEDNIKIVCDSCDVGYGENAGSCAHDNKLSIKYGEFLEWLKSVIFSTRTLVLGLRLIFETHCVEATQFLPSHQHPLSCIVLEVVIGGTIHV